MSYFKYFPKVPYKFGNETSEDTFENISVYADIIDQIKNDVAAYEEYYILPGERPDQVSLKLYDTPNYHWTFFLLNDDIKEQGWPLSNENLFKYAEKEYNNTVLVTRANIANIFNVGQTVSGLVSGAEAVIKFRDVTLGQIWIKTPATNFINGETISTQGTGQFPDTAILKSSSLQYNAIHHYEDVNGIWKDLGFENDGSISEPAVEWTPITWLNRLNNQNDELKKIKIIKPNIIGTIAESFREAVSL